MTTEQEIEAAVKALSSSQWCTDKSIPTRIATLVLEAAEKARWRPIEEAPKDGTELLLTCDIYGVEIGSWKDDDNLNEHGWFSRHGDDFSTGYYYALLTPTHFQYLPSPPEEK